jgi:hypothetical protein
MNVQNYTDWLRQEQDINAARLAFVLRERGIDVKTLICAKVFPGVHDPTSGVVITPQEKVFQFAFNRAGMIIESAQLDEWVNITSTFMQHPWRDDILSALMILKKTSATPGVEEVNG